MVGNSGSRTMRLSTRTRRRGSIRPPARTRARASTARGRVRGRGAAIGFSLPFGGSVCGRGEPWPERRDRACVRPRTHAARLHPGVELVRGHALAVLGHVEAPRRVVPLRLRLVGRRVVGIHAAGRLRPHRVGDVAASWPGAAATDLVDRLAGVVGLRQDRAGRAQIRIGGHEFARHRRQGKACCPRETGATSGAAAGNRPACAKPGSRISSAANGAIRMSVVRDEVRPECGAHAQADKQRPGPRVQTTRSPALGRASACCWNWRPISSGRSARCGGWSRSCSPARSGGLHERTALAVAVRADQATGIDAIAGQVVVRRAGATLDSDWL